MVLQLLCACSIILCFCLLLFPHCFCHCRLVLFHPAVCLFYLCLSSVEEGIDSWACLVFFCLFFLFFKIFSFFLLHAFSTAVFVLFLQVFLAMFVISFGLVSLSFTQFLLLTFSIVPCFFSSCFFILVFTSILLYKRIWAFMDLYQSKGSWTQFSIICQSHSFKDLYSTTNMYSTVDLYFATYHFPLHFFLSPGISVGFCFFSVFFFWAFLALWSFWWAFGICFLLGFFLMGFWV